MQTVCVKEIELQHAERDGDHLQGGRGLAHPARRTCTVPLR